MRKKHTHERSRLHTQTDHSSAVSPLPLYPFIPVNCNRYPDVFNFQVELLEQWYSDKIKELEKEKEKYHKAHQETLKSLQLMQQENSKLKSTVLELQKQNAKQSEILCENTLNKMITANEKLHGQEEDMECTVKDNHEVRNDTCEDNSEVNVVDNGVEKYTNLLSIGGKFTDKDFKHRELLVAVVVLEGENRELKNLVQKLKKDLEQKDEETEKLAKLLEEVTHMKIISYAEQGEIAG